MCWAAVKCWPNVCAVSAKMLHRVLKSGRRWMAGKPCAVRDAIGFVYVKLCCK